MDGNARGYKKQNFKTTAEASTSTCGELLNLSPHADTGSSDKNDIQSGCVQLSNGRLPYLSQTTTTWKPFGCEICGKRFTLKGSLKTHEKLHGSRPTYSCDVCGKSFKVPSGLKAHAALHSGSKPFSCEVCGKTFTLKGSLKTHSAIHSEVRESFCCHICGKTYKGMASLRSHTALHLGQKPLPPKEQDTPKNPNDSISNDGLTTMTHNPTSTDMTAKQMTPFDFWHRFPQLFHAYELPEHIMPIPGSSPPVAPPPTGVDYSKKEMACPSGDSQDSAMLGNQSDDLTFFIGQSFMSKYSKNTQPLSIRNRPFVCETCGKRFTLKGSLKTHEKLHSFRETYHCSICGKSFKVEDGLKSHSVLHTNRRPFLCFVCGRGFTLKGSLKTHLTLHSLHRQTYPCEICGKVYKSRLSYDSHRAQHLGQRLHQCEVCNKSFTLKGSLKLHSVLHSGVKPYSCQVCGVSFALRSHLTRHFRVHNGR